MPICYVITTLCQDSSIHCKKKIDKPRWRTFAFLHCNRNISTKRCYYQDSNWSSRSNQKTQFCSVCSSLICNWRPFSNCLTKKVRLDAYHALIYFIQIFNKKKVCRLVIVVVVGRDDLLTLLSYELHALNFIHFFAIWHSFIYLLITNELQFVFFI